MRACCLVLLVLLSFQPELARSEPDQAGIGLYVVDISRIDELANTFEIELDVITSWTDPDRATGEEVHFRNDAAREFNRGGWAPDMFPTNAKDGVSISLLHTVLHPDGRIVNRARLATVLRAPLDFRSFPFDRQALPIHVESFSWDQDALQLVVDEDFSGFDRGFDLPEWTILDTTSEITTSRRLQEGREFSRLEFTIHVQRRAGYYLWKVLLPVLIITAISWVVFWMSNEGLGRRAGVSVTGMLTVIAYQFAVAGSLPRFPYLTVLDQIALLALILIALTMAENMITSRMDEAGRTRFDRSCRVFFPLALLAGLVAILTPALRA